METSPFHLIPRLVAKCLMLGLDDFLLLTSRGLQRPQEEATAPVGFCCCRVGFLTGWPGLCPLLILPAEGRGVRGVQP